MRFCKYCGEKVSEQDVICPACGRDIRPSNSKSSAPVPSSGPAEKAPASPASKSAASDSVPGPVPVSSASSAGSVSDSVPGPVPVSSASSAGFVSDSVPGPVPVSSAPSAGPVPVSSAGPASGPAAGAEPTAGSASAQAVRSAPFSSGNNAADRGNRSGGKRLYIYIAAAAVLIAVIAGAAVFSGRCRSEGCKNRKAPGSNYCYNHKCDVPDCKNERLSWSNYCYEHYSMYDDEAKEEENQAYSWLLSISDVKVYSEYSFTYAEGTLTNNNDTTVNYVKLKGAFKNRMGTVIDTDWTYAVGGEGLAPGESCKWKMSVTKDASITDCDVTILEDN